MAKEFKAPMVQDFKVEMAEITDVTTDKTGATTTNLVKLCEGGTNESKITAIHFKCQGTSDNATALIFLKQGTDYLLFDEVFLSAKTSNATTPSEQNRALYDDLAIASGTEVYVGVTAIEGTTKWNAFAIMAEYKAV